MLERMRLLPWKDATVKQLDSEAPTKSTILPWHISNELIFVLFSKTKGGDPSRPTSEEVPSRLLFSTLTRINRTDSSLEWHL